MNSFRLAGSVALAAGAVLTAAPAHAAPLPGFCAPDVVVDGICTTRLASVTTDVVNGTITGTPVGGTEAVTLTGQADAYLESDGFGDTPPEPVANWDTTLAQVSGLGVSPADPNWYGNAKARVFLPRTLNDLATHFPPGSLLVRFTADEAQPGAFQLVSIQPTLR
ncbi:hypothetical protein H7J08_10355 [Mycobacterium frederiksbergense]|uniref:hypothetical protein n=1 Tax=Mycolicibacterium frederiksbergense TaxID=117567 RepID=UPI0021F37BAE|nr:hypothetical protein [Mycolicibacterium frederiksbergense]MCV7045070.1 hypothetical protein [Mycolicibacterium frederiksbergense]